MKNEMNRMKELVTLLNEAGKVYYQGQDEIMSNYEYDKLYDELVQLEEMTGITMANSPTVHVGYETVSELPKEAHISPMLSLGKTKEVEELVSWIADKDGLLSLKLDGLSIILTYENGVLTKALTRGNGEIGEVITNNAKTFKNIPARIQYKDTLVIRGEALIRYSDFEELNRTTTEIQEKYKNPRNLCSGTVRQRNNEITAQRSVYFYTYNVIAADESFGTFAEKEDELRQLEKLGFDIVPYKKVTQTNLQQAVKEFSEEIADGFDLPSDGLVLTYNDKDYSSSLGRTAKFPRDSIAFKWQDEIAETKLLEVEWSASRTGLINPIAVFEPVELEGTTVSRASLHNISILRELELGLGDQIQVYKANMIIPQLYENLTRSNSVEVPHSCPVCGGDTEVKSENSSEFLYCANEQCYAKKIKLFSHFVGREALNIEGLSEATLEKFVNMGWLHTVEDIFQLERYQEQIEAMEGFGEKSFKNLMDAIEKAKKVPVERLLYSLGMKGFGLSMAKLVCKNNPRPLSEMNQLTREDLVQIDGIGEKLAESFVEFFSKVENMNLVQALESILDISYPEENLQEQLLIGKVFVITGSLERFTNRSECKNKIEELGGKVSGSVSKNTDYLVNNDLMSTSSKNKKAKELGIPIITEEELCDLLGL